MAKSLGKIIPWILVTVLGFLALSILFMARARYEGFVAAAPPSATTTKPLPPPPPPMTVDQHIVVSLNDMITKLTRLQNDLQNAVIDISGVRGTVCSINNGIQKDYVKTKIPPASQAELTATPDRQKVYAENRKTTGLQAWQLAQSYYTFSNRVTLLDCTPPAPKLKKKIDISGGDISGATQKDVSGATPPPPPVEGFFAPPDPTQVTDLLAKLQEVQDMFITYSKTTEVRSWLDTIGKIPNTEAFLSSLMTTAEKNYEGFQNEGDEDISGADVGKPFVNAYYTYPVPYKDTQINNTQSKIYKKISAAYDVYSGFIKKVGKQYQTAKYQAGVLAIKYNKYRAIKSKNKQKTLSFET
jgi:hypothetical protein